MLVVILKFGLFAVKLLVKEMSYRAVQCLCVNADLTPLVCLLM